MKLLLVEDNERMAEFIRKGLIEAGHTLDQAANGRDGASAHASSRPGVLQPEHGNDMVAAVHPQLKPDYPCQNLHVREPDCPPR